MERETIDVKYIPYSIARSLVYRRVSEGSVSMFLERVWDYLREFGEGDPDLAARALERLISLGVPDDIAAVVLSICPRSRGELLSIYQMRKDFVPPEEHFDQVLEEIKEFCRTTPFYEESAEQ